MHSHGREDEMLVAAAIGDVREMKVCDRDKGQQIDCQSSNTGLVFHNRAKAA